MVPTKRKINKYAGFYFYENNPILWQEGEYFKSKRDYIGGDVLEIKMVNGNIFMVTLSDIAYDINFNSGILVYLDDCDYESNPMYISLDYSEDKQYFIKLKDIKEIERIR